MSTIVGNVQIQIKGAQYYVMIYNCTVNYEHRNSMIGKIFLSSLILLKNSFVVETNIWISIFK